MIEINIGEVLLQGQFKNITGVNEKDIIEKFGKPEEVEEYRKANTVFYHYDNIRLKFFEKQLSEVTMFFYNYVNEYPIKLMDEDINLSRETAVNQVISILNESGIVWNINYHESSLDYLVITTMHQLKIYYYLRDGKLERITKEIG